ncbi:uncharacterized protein APUU_30644S [Aspergillus puulaauensis]|uniref:Uncharacterized protein n=1 Tax=Aspergillus puulaauensis TaxID=1220207 RepID=A0A7R8AK35_9EURO|nr:uncharacterized protein APUU_30644S [Aspergillus puulaauensis]BCS22419.1 hypothetical protein APUU_30644S [Aspergillus puulaauensis]
MTYKSNYEPYTSQTSQSFDLSGLRPSIELLYPLGDLYPHVVALQLQSEDENPWSASKNFSGYQDIAYWAEVVSSPRSLPEHYSKRSFRRCSESTKSRFVSRIRRLLSRDELRKRRRFA